MLSYKFTKFDTDCTKTEYAKQSSTGDGDRCNVQRPGVNSAYVPTRSIANIERPGAHLREPVEKHKFVVGAEPAGMESAALTDVESIHLFG